MVNSSGHAESLGLRDRLDLLEGADVITPRARSATERAVAPIEAFAGIPLDDEGGQQFVTHLAMTLTRLDRDEEAPALPGTVGEEIAERHEEWAFARALATQWEVEFGRALPESEIAYVVVHLSVLRVRAQAS
jgi:hypothetical protein